MTPEDAAKVKSATHPGFTIICDACGHDIVAIESDVGYSALSGGWGSVYLLCITCRETTNVWEMS